MRKILALAAFVLASLGVGSTAQAQMITAKDPSSIVQVLQKKGYRAELTKDDSGDPMIRSASSGTNFLVLFYGCTANKDCATIQFTSGFTSYKNATVESINAWNTKNRWGRAYINEKGAARLEMDVDLDDGGMSALLFEDNLEYWVAVVANFEKHITGG